MADFPLGCLVAADEATAEAVTGLPVLPISGDGVPGIGWTMEVDGWRPPAPFPSWTWTDDAWQAPLPHPSDGAPYYWDEVAGGWIEYVAPEPDPDTDTE
jgi:hypothetical protein